ncbi:MAG: class I SAM-dependent methyltransferase [Victivallaceae bacterium]|nr:class I SAM-dependent methyltransferase [Victivallaceae bacterium]
MSDNRKGHSEEYFKADRDFWWNHDFLELMARRLCLNECSTLLDVGCGQCHWSRLLVGFLKKPAAVHALDADLKWAGNSDGLKQFFSSRGATVTFKHGDAHTLPYTDNFFDAVTCQTLLIHLNDPKAAIVEMQRAVKPGGLVLCVEPNNIANASVRSNLSADAPVEDVLKNIRYAIMCERGKASLGEGDNSYGDLLPGVFAELGFEDIRTYLSDKASPIYPPYKTPEQQAILQSYREWAAETSGPYDKSANQRYLAALGEDGLAFSEEMQTRLKNRLSEIFEAVKNGYFSTGGGNIMYLVSGRKPK